MMHPAPVFIPALLSNLKFAVIRFALALLIILLIASLGGNLNPLAPPSSAGFLSAAWFQHTLPKALVSSLAMAIVATRPAHNALPLLALASLLGCAFAMLHRWCFFRDHGDQFRAGDALAIPALLVILPAVLLASWWRLETASRRLPEPSASTHTGP